MSAEGLGCMGMTWAYGAGDEQSGTATIHRALELGVTFLDTAEVYGPYTNEELVGRAIAGRRDEFEIATKFGFVIDPDNPPSGAGSTAARRTCAARCEGSLERLGHRLHRPLLPAPGRSQRADRGDGRRDGRAGAGRQGPLHRTVGGVAGDDPPRRTRPIRSTAVQSEYSLWTRDPEDEVLPTLRELGIGLVAYSPLGPRVPHRADPLARRPARGRLAPLEPALPGGGAAREPRSWPTASTRARASSATCTPAQLALAWVLAKGEDIVPIPGTKSPRDSRRTRRRPT